MKEIGQDPERVLSLASGAAAAEALDAETSRARELGIFGSPTFAVGRELFWGDDRLDDALGWYRHRAVQPSPAQFGGRAAV